MQPEVGPDRITFRGKLITRAKGFVDLNEITCPGLHRMRLGGFSIHETGGLTCHNKAAAGQGECGALIWLFHMPGVHSRKRFYMADVEYREIDLWEKCGATADEILKYLGAWLIRQS